MKALALDVKGMSCQHCVRSVTDALRSLDGVAVRTVGIGNASVEYDPDRVTTAAIVDAVVGQGYDASVVESKAAR